MRRPPVACLAAVLALAALAGCGATSSRALHRTLAALSVRAIATPAAASPAGPPSCLPSLRPPAALPAPGAMPAGSFAATIARHGHLVAGVDQNTLLLAYRNPRDAQFEGFEIDILHEVARAIFGNPDAIEFRAITTARRAAVVQDRSVDLVADAFTITCRRARQVDFSAPYFAARQGLLVPSDSLAQSIGALRGRRVCATTGSTSIENVMRHPGVIPYPVAQRTDCLVALQEGAVDGIASDDAILRGFAAQDPYTRLVTEPRSPAPYGIAISLDHPDFVRFINGVLARIRADGTWRRIYAKWFGAPAPPPPTPRYAG
ncbi:MAG: polar amino acid transport system substrate-binding protein [Solirubrobacteraceae bacterium]|nr:polar amino acid transport system substrate-binding protein [Solirubrobacteraceae bacterium]